MAAIPIVLQAAQMGLGAVQANQQASAQRAQQTAGVFGGPRVRPQAGGRTEVVPFPVPAGAPAGGAPDRGALRPRGQGPSGMEGLEMLPITASESGVVGAPGVGQNAQQILQLLERLSRGGGPGRRP